MTRWKKRQRSCLPGNSRGTEHRDGERRGGGRRRGRSNSESVRTIIWRWQRDGQDERSTSPSTLMSSRRSFSFFVFACLRTFANARHTGFVLNTARFHGRNICPSPSRGVKHANFGVSQKCWRPFNLDDLLYAAPYERFSIFFYRFIFYIKTNIAHLS